jgi:hypothetical protein
MLKGASIHPIFHPLTLANALTFAVAHYTQPEKTSSLVAVRIVTKPFPTTQQKIGDAP